MTDAETKTKPAQQWYGLELGEFFAPDSNTIIRRVPGGWVHANVEGGCFIPFDNEFQPRGVADDLPL